MMPAEVVDRQRLLDKLEERPELVTVLGRLR